MIKKNINWNNKIKNNFNNAASNYSQYSLIQKNFAKIIVSLLKEINIPYGKSFDLGAGTGFLADLMEDELRKEPVTRIDFCQKMLSTNKTNSKKILWDLNKGLPSIVKDSSLIVSSFCLHWLNHPEKIVEKWFNALIMGGVLVIAFPNNNSFPEWRETCTRNNLKYSGINFPNPDLLISLFKKDEIYSINNYYYLETFPDIYKLFRNIIKMGAQSTKSERLQIKDYKMIQELWPKNKTGSISLTWKISIIIFKKNYD